MGKWAMAELFHACELGWALSSLSWWQTALQHLWVRPKPALDVWNFKSIWIWVLLLSYAFIAGLSCVPEPQTQGMGYNASSKHKSLKLPQTSPAQVDEFSFLNCRVYILWVLFRAVKHDFDLFNHGILDSLIFSMLQWGFSRTRSITRLLIKSLELTRLALGRAL